MPAGPEASLSSARALLADLAGYGPIERRLLIVVAHPDDETMGLGGQISRLDDALLLHVTDGAPRDGEDARQHGFGALADYAAARQRELAEALIAGEATGVRRFALDIPDKEAVVNLCGLTHRLVELLRWERPTAVLTHAYEGGHPDHDAAAFAVHAACRCLGAEQAIVEMPLYHAENGQFVGGRFLPDSTDEVTIVLGAADLQRKRRMVECFSTQRDILARFELSPERFRSARMCNFGQPPHPGALLYETFGWGIDGAEWRRVAAAALTELGLDRP